MICEVLGTGSIVVLFMMAVAYMIICFRDVRSDWEDEE